MLPARQVRLLPISRAMKSLIRKHSIVINGRAKSISIEDAFWEPLQEIATDRGTSVANVISLIDAHHQNTNLTSAIRLTVLEFYRDQKLPSWISSGHLHGDRDRRAIATHSSRPRAPFLNTVLPSASPVPSRVAQRLSTLTAHELA